MTKWIVAPTLEQAAAEEQQKKTKTKTRKSHRVEYDMEHTPRSQRVGIAVISRWSTWSEGHIHRQMRLHQCPPSLPRKKPTDHHRWLAGDWQDFERAGHSMEEWLRLRAERALETQ